MQKKKVKLEEPQLIEALLNKHRLGMEALYDMYSGALLGVISRIIPQTEIAEDVLQEAFVKIWNSIANYDASKGRLFTWMLNIARNLSIDKVRSKDFRNHSQNQDLENNVSVLEMEQNSIFNTETIGIKELVKKLKPELQNLLDLIYFKGYTHVEAAEKLDLPLGTVKTRLRTAILELRNNFN